MRIKALCSAFILSLLASMLVAGAAVAEASTGDISLTYATTGKEEIPWSTIAYDASDIALDSHNTRGVMTQVYIPSSGVIIMYCQTNSNSVYPDLYRFGGLPVKGFLSETAVDEDSVWNITKSGYLAKSICIPEAGTYYLGVTSEIHASTKDPNKIAAAGAIFAPDTDRTIVNKQQVAIGADYGQTVNLKFKATTTGYLKATANSKYDDLEPQSVRLTLCNSKKDPISNKTYCDDDTDNPVFGVKKGNTYYLRVEGTSNSDGTVFALKAKNVKVSEKSGNSAAKAKNLKRNKIAKGTITAGSSACDWYKIKLTKSQILNIDFEGNTCDELKLFVYKDGKKVKKGLEDGCSFDSDNPSNGTISDVPLTKGTYYIKVSRANSKSSGYYKLKWY